MFGQNATGSQPQFTRDSVPYSTAPPPYSLDTYEVSKELPDAKTVDLHAYQAFQQRGGQGMQADTFVDGLTKIFEQYRIPVALISKL